MTPADDADHPRPDDSGARDASPEASADALTYADAGVDIAAGEKAIELIKAHVRSTFRPEVVGDVGGFGGLFALGKRTERDPVLVASTDGVGTKSIIARMMHRYDTIGIDLVGTADDIAAQGAEPLFFLDYISVGKLVPETIDAIVSGIAEGCRRARCALIGGEMSEHPDALGPDDFDLVGFAVGVAERSELLPRGVSAGDHLIGIASPGLRCNGYSLARRALLDRQGRTLDSPAWPGAAHSLGEELLRPSEIYAPVLMELRRAVEVHAYAHVTGGGIPGNLVRVLPNGCDGVVRRGSWEEPRIFREIQVAGDVADAEMEQVFNLGVGMIAAVPGRDRFHALDAVRASGHEAWAIGEVVDGHGAVHMQRA